MQLNIVFAILGLCAAVQETSTSRNANSGLLSRAAATRVSQATAFSEVEQTASTEDIQQERKNVVPLIWIFVGAKIFGIIYAIRRMHKQGIWKTMNIAYVASSMIGTAAGLATRLWPVDAELAAEDAELAAELADGIHLFCFLVVALFVGAVVVLCFQSDSGMRAFFAFFCTFVCSAYTKVVFLLWDDLLIDPRSSAEKKRNCSQWIIIVAIALGGEYLSSSVTNHVKPDDEATKKHDSELSASSVMSSEA